MTYCVAVSTSAGLVFCSDSRTNAGPDILSTYSKMHTYELGDERMLVVMSAGNLATTQAVIAQLDADLEDEQAESLRNCERMVDVVKYVARVSREQQDEARDSTGSADINTAASFIVGGQIKDAPPRPCRLSARTTRSNSNSGPLALGLLHAGGHEGQFVGDCRCYHKRVWVPHPEAAVDFIHVQTQADPRLQLVPEAAV